MNIYTLKHGITIAVQTILFLEYLFTIILLLKKNPKKEVRASPNEENKLNDRPHKKTEEIKIVISCECNLGTKEEKDESTG